HHVLEILAGIQNGLEFGGRVLPHVAVEGVLAGDDDRALGRRWLRGGRCLPAGRAALLAGAWSGREQDREQDDSDHSRFHASQPPWMSHGAAKYTSQGR